MAAEEKINQPTEQSQPHPHMHHQSLGAQDVGGAEPSSVVNPVAEDEPESRHSRLPRTHHRP